MLTAATENVRSLAQWSRLEYDSAGVPPGRRKITSVGIIGAGMMGTSIAAAHAQYRLPVVIHDADEAALGRAGAAVAAELREAECHISPSTLARLVRPTAQLAEAAQCDLVLESIPESVPAKLRLYAQLAACLGEQTIVASNTSTIPIERLASGLPDASRFCGLHYCHPVRQRPLVEIVRGPRTSEQTLTAALAHARRINRMPIMVEDGPGFVVNRLLFPDLGEALELLQEGQSPESIEEAAAEFGMAFGPLRMMDEIGLDTTLQAGLVLGAAFPQRVVFSPLLVSMVKARRLGRKTGAGFFSYEYDDLKAGVAVELPPQQRGLVAGAAVELPPQHETVELPPQHHLTYRLILPMLLEATRILEEGKVGDARDIDLAVLFGLGFPAEKGGLLWWADTLGLARILALLQSLGSMGPRAEPTSLLVSMAQSGGRFYGSGTAGF